MIIVCTECGATIKALWKRRLRAELSMHLFAVHEYSMRDAVELAYKLI